MSHDKMPDGERIVTDADTDGRVEKHSKLMALLNNGYPVDHVLIWEDGVWLNRQNTQANFWALMIDNTVATIFDASDIASTLKLEKRIEHMIEHYRETQNTDSTTAAYQ